MTRKIRQAPRTKPRTSRAAGTPEVYRSMKAFHRRRGGARSAESDYGSNHYDDYSALGGGAPGSVRVTYVHDTGDFYAIDQSNPETAEQSRVALLGALAGQDGTPMPPEKADELMRGWLAPPGAGRPLSWFVARIQERARSGRLKETA